MTSVFAKGFVSGTEREAQGQPGSIREKDTLADLVAEMIAEDGVPSPEAYRWADAVLKQSCSDDLDAA
jgi:hypothetical protein